MEITTTTPQKRPFWRAQAAPYDGPASAARASGLSHSAEARPGDGARGFRWLSKLAGPASIIATRIGTRGTWRHFSSVPRKRSTAKLDNASEIELIARFEFDHSTELLLRSGTAERSTWKRSFFSSYPLAKRSRYIETPQLTKNASRTRGRPAAYMMPPLQRSKLPVPLTAPAKSPLTTSRGCKFSYSKPLNLNDRRQVLNGAKNTTTNAVASVFFAPVPSRSSELARRILEQLDIDDELQSPSKGSSSELKIAEKEESPSTLACDDMQHERAHRSMEDEDSSKFPRGVPGDNQIEIASDSFHEDLRVQSTPEANPATFIQDEVESNMKSSELQVLSGSTSAQKKPSFCISLPDDLLDVDDDDDDCTTTELILEDPNDSTSGKKKPSFCMSAPEDLLALDDDDDDDDDDNDCTATQLVLEDANESTSGEKKPSFCMSVPEDLLDLDDDDYTTKDSFNSPTVEDEQTEILPECQSTPKKRLKLPEVGG